MYRIKDWARYFENHASHKVIDARWVPVPNKHDGKGFRRIARHPQNVAIFCAWNLILQVASKCWVRGDLADENGPLTALDLADATGFPEEIFEQAFQALSDPKIGWIVEIPWPVPAELVIVPTYRVERTSHPDKAAVHPDASGRPGTEGKGREGKGTERKEDPPPSPRVPATPYDQAVTDVLREYPKTREREGGRVEQVHVGEGDRNRIADFMNASPDYPLLDAVKAYAKATKRPKNLREWLMNPTAREIVLKAMEAAKARDNPAAADSGPLADPEAVRKMARDVSERLKGGGPNEARRMQNAA